MKIAPKLRRLALVLALMPQLIVLALGSGVVVCVAPGGHLQVEVAVSACCSDSGSQAGNGISVVSPDEPDCGSCSDIQIALDPRESVARNVELPSETAPALPAETRAFPGPGELVRSFGFGGPGGRGGRVPPHLSHLRSVVLRC